MSPGIPFMMGRVLLSSTLVHKSNCNPPLLTSEKNVGQTNLTLRLFVCFCKKSTRFWENEWNECGKQMLSRDDQCLFVCFACSLFVCLLFVQNMFLSVRSEIMKNVANKCYPAMTNRCLGRWPTDCCNNRSQIPPGHKKASKSWEGLSSSAKSYPGPQKDIKKQRRVIFFSKKA